MFRFKKALRSFKKDYDMHCRKNRGSFNTINNKIHFLITKKSIIKDKELVGCYHAPYKEVPVKEVVQMILDYLNLELDEVYTTKLEKNIGLKRKEK